MRSARGIAHVCKILIGEPQMKISVVSITRRI
jgi:hypothetical protein